MTEVWKPIFDGSYSISNYGNVWSEKRGRKLKRVKRNHGYFAVTLMIDGTRNQCLVHRLVATEFLENPNNCAEVNHKDFNKLNCHVDNLEWMSHKDNMRHAVVNGRFNHKEVVDSSGNRYTSITEAAEKLNIDRSFISKVCKGKFPCAKGIGFEYVEVNENG